MASETDLLINKVNDPVIVGGVKCDFLKLDDFREIARRWLGEDRFHHIVTLNPEMIMLAQNDREFKEALEAADLRVPDGAGIIWARWYLRSKYWSLWPSLAAFAWQPVERISGVDMVEDLAKLSARAGRPLFLTGGRPGAGDATKSKLIKRLPDLEIIVRPEINFEVGGPADLVAEINSIKPGVLLAAFGAPKQTIWLESLREKLRGVSIAAGVGGAFEILSEDLPRAPQALRQYNMEWLWRLYLQPARLPRIWQAIFKYPNLIRKQKTGS